MKPTNFMGPKAAKHEFRGEMLTARQIAQRTGMSEAAIYRRIRLGQSLEAPKSIGPRATLFEFRGRYLTAKEIVTITGMSKSTVYNHRIGNRVAEGDDLKDPFREPHPNALPITFGGKTLPLSQWAKQRGINANTLKARIRRGWTIERTLTEPVMLTGTRAARHRRNAKIIREMIATINASIHADRRTTTTGTGGYEQTFPNQPGTGAGRHAHDLQAGMKSYDRHA